MFFVINVNCPEIKVKNWIYVLLLANLSLDRGVLIPFVAAWLTLIFRVSNALIVYISVPLIP